MKRHEAEQLFQENIRFAHYILSSYYPASSKDEDLHQEALIGLWQACTTYDKNRGKFSTYAGYCILSQIRKALRKRYRQPETVSLHAPIVEGGLPLEQILEDPCPETSDDWFALKLFFDGLNEEQRQIIQYRAEGLTQRQIAAKFGRSRTWVCNNLKGLQQKYLEQEDQHE